MSATAEKTAKSKNWFKHHKLISSSATGVVVSLTLLSAQAYAQTSVSFGVAAGYAKGNNKFAVVVKAAPGTKLELYVNDKHPTKATANKKDWATFNGVKLTGTGKLSFTKVVSGKQKPINYTRRYTVKSGKVSFSAYATTAKAKTTAAAPKPAAQPTTAQQVAAWDKQYGHFFNKLKTDFDMAQSDLQVNDINAFATDCATIASDAVAAESTPPIPDVDIQTVWMQAMGDYAAGGAACSDGINFNDTNELTQGVTDFNSGSDALDKATQMINAL